MVEKIQTFQVSIGQTKRISVLSGTKEIFRFTPDFDAAVRIEIKITETTP